MTLQEKDLNNIGNQVYESSNQIFDQIYDQVRDKRWGENWMQIWIQVSLPVLRKFQSKINKL